MPLVKIAGFNNANSRITNTAVHTRGAGDIANKVAMVTANVAEGLANHADGLRSVEAQGEFERNVDSRIAELDPASADYMEQVSTIYEEAQGEANENAGLRMSGNKDRLQSSLARQSEAGKVAALQMQKSALTKQATGKFQELATSTLDKIRQMPGDYETWQAELDAKIEEFGGAIPPELQEALIDDFTKSAIEAQVEGFAEQGNHTAAQATLEENSGLLSSQERRSLTALQRSIESRQDQEVAAERTRQFAGLETDVLEATSVKDLNAVRDRMDAFESIGGFEDNPRAKPMLIRQLQAKQKSMVQADRTLTNSFAQYESGLGLDSQGQADDVFAVIQRRVMEEGGEPGDVLAAGVDFARNSGYAPSFLIDAMGRAERMDNPEQLAAAARIQVMLKEQAPSAVAKVPGEGRKVSLTAALTRTGMSYEEAAQTATQLATDKPAMKERRDAFENDFAKTDLREEMEDYDLGDADQIPAAALSRFREATRAFYELTGEHDTAIAAAAEEFGKRNRPSALAGGSTQEFGPELTFPTSSAYTPDDVNDVVSQDVEAMFGELGLAVPEDYNGKKGWRLVPDAVTKRQIEQGETPTYAVETMQYPAGEAGIYMRQSLITEGGQQVPMRWGQFTNETLKASPSYANKLDKGAISMQRGRQLEDKNQQDSVDPAMLRGYK